MSAHHPAEQPEELLQCYDEAGNPTEVRPRAEVKREPHRWWYATARIWVVNDRGQIMCSKRAEGLKGNPGKWQTYFGGHVGAGHTFLETAQRELAEEAGIDLPKDAFFFVDRGRNEIKKSMYENYAVRFNGQPSDLRFTDHEVTEAKWMGMEDYWQEKEAHPDLWCNSCSPEQQRLLREWLERR